MFLERFAQFIVHRSVLDDLRNGGQNLGNFRKLDRLLLFQFLLVIPAISYGHSLFQEMIERQFHLAVELSHLRIDEPTKEVAYYACTLDVVRFGWRGNDMPSLDRVHDHSDLAVDLLVHKSDFGIASAFPREHLACRT